MSKIFISYRRDDSAGYSGRLADRLAQEFGEDQVFRDYEDIAPGQNYVKTIQHNLASAEILLLIIGANWLTVKSESGQLRLDNSQDFVRLEIETALQRNIQLIPLLVNAARMPNAVELPKSLSALAYLQAVELTDSRWEQDVDDLILAIKDRINPAAKPPARRLFAYLILSALVICIVIWQNLKQTDFSGQWYFIGGDYLAISQQAAQVSIEHIDPATQTVYEKGVGQVTGRTLTFTLEPIYSSRFKYQGRLHKSWDGQTLEGELLELYSDQRSSLSLQKYQE